MTHTTSRIRIISTVLASALVFTVASASAHGHGHKEQGARMFEKADTNQDGKITRAEAKQMHDRHFAQVDTNQDGAITKEEAKAAWERMRAERKQARSERKAKRGGDPKGKDRAKKGQAHAHHGPRGKGKSMGAKFFERMDANKDGKITRAEADDVQSKRFNKVDANQDGAITRDEAQAHHQAMKEKWKKKHAERKGGEAKGKKK